jgi:hypothetical protein
VRGGHPQQREAGGAWGAAGAGEGPEAGAPVGRVLQGGASGAGRAGTAGATPASGTRVAGPKKEYVDAFDDEVYGGGVAASAFRGQARSGEGRPGGRAAGGETVDAAGGGAGNGPAGGGGGGAAGGMQGNRGRAPRAKKPGRARAVTGVVAAAVTTVLAVVIAGQVTGGGRGHGKEAASSMDDKGGGRPPSATAHSPRRASGGPSASPKSTPLSYAATMDRLLPLKADYKGKGTFASVPGHDKAPAPAAQPMRYRVDVEKGLPLDGELFAKAVQKTLNDKRSWAHGGQRSFERVGSGHADFVISLASPGTTDVWCAKSGLDTSEENVSCDSASTDRVMINAYRWAKGAKTFGKGRIHQYRQMLINHEVGHRLGHGHVGCPKDGALAPVMMQQTKFLTTNGAKCRPNAWPYPPGESP